ncbi:hypothetical protein OGAPHI_005984 [Ogataea philodendri]|uniref:Sugar phosphate transporter domain-containing protein n=1 Tax=Ogataea philodendri TaxID=1378263 RepID=A0A9P8T1L2_9ASCO|nr:uncharacterized protein OGAPHI_005984 [Ogataea philodendri]KAH3661806.1 hypothetical protein OGAPHI_005984 [Ogataea philodendri]
MIFPGLLTFSGCCSNVVSMELISQLNPVPTHLVTALQYLSISLLVAPFVPYSNNPPPRLSYLLTTTLFFLSAIGNNLAFKYGMTVPVHIVVRSSSTPLTVLVGTWLFGRRYSAYQIIGATVLSIGITITTLAGSNNSASEGLAFMGIAIVVSSTLLGVLVSFWNNKILNTYNLNWIQTLFYSHFYGIPSLLLFFGSIARDLELYRHSTKFWNFTAVNTITQLACVTGVNMLAQKTDPLTLGVILLIRRFMSLAISIVMFKHNLSAMGYLGMTTASLGAIIYQLHNRRSIFNQLLHLRNGSSMNKRAVSDCWVQSGTKTGVCIEGFGQFEQKLVLTTPSGTPASTPKTAMAIADNGVSAAGFTTAVHPAASAAANFLEIMARGKFQGVMIPTGPTGCHWVYIRFDGVAELIVSPYCLTASSENHLKKLAA